MKNTIYGPLLLGTILFAGCAKVGAPVPSEDAASSTEYLSSSASSSKSSSSSSNNQGGSGHTYQPGVITAGAWSDLDNWTFWLEILQDKDYSDMPGYWEFYTNHRISVHLTDANAQPVVDAIVQLKKNGATLFTARTDNQGKAELWAGLFQKESTVDLRALSIDINNGSKIISSVKSYKEGVNNIRLSTGTTFPNKVEISFVVDATGSMGDELEYLKAELYNVIDRAKSDNPGVKMAISAVFYRDEGDDYLTRVSGFSDNINSTINFIKAQSAGGGGDFPEAVHTALDKAINGLQWSSSARARILFLILDAPPHYQPSVLKSLQTSIINADKKGIKIIPVTASGINKKTEFIMRFFAIATNGTYVFITDDSGIGNAHLKPTVGKYKVEFLNNLMVRLINKYAQ